MGWSGTAVTIQNSIKLESPFRNWENVLTFPYLNFIPRDDGKIMNLDCTAINNRIDFLTRDNSIMQFMRQKAYPTLYRGADFSPVQLILQCDHAYEDIW